MADRDPRIDPRVGDIVQVRHDRRKVIAVLDDGIKWRSPWDARTCSLKTWRKWARDAVEVERG